MKSLKRDKKPEIKQKKQDKEEKISKKTKRKSKDVKKRKVTELILPDLNLKTEAVLSLFEDVDYDLNTVDVKKQ